MINDSTLFRPLNLTEKKPEEMMSASRSFYESVKTRRTVRDFSERSIPDEVIRNAIRAAGTAPSGANIQPGIGEVLQQVDDGSEGRLPCTVQISDLLLLAE